MRQTLAADIPSLGCVAASSIGSLHNFQLFACTSHAAQSEGVQLGAHHMPQGLYFL
jgi:hypothetical protein